MMGKIVKEKYSKHMRQCYICNMAYLAKTVGGDFSSSVQQMGQCANLHFKI